MAHPGEKQTATPTSSEQATVPKHEASLEVQKAVVASLATSRTLAQSTLDALTAHIAVLDENGVILMVNQAWKYFARENNYRLQDYGVGINYLRLCEASTDLPEAQEVARGIRAALNGLPEEFALEYPCHTPRRKYWFNVRITRFEEDGMLRVVVAHEDVTRLKIVEEALLQQTDELIRSNADLERFAFIASHDLQEPLRMVISFTQLLSRRYKGRMDADADEFIMYAADGALRMQRLINDLLGYSRLNTRGQQFTLTNCSLLVEQAIEDLNSALQETGGSVTSGPLPTVLGDESQLRQLFQNLIGNGLKFHGPNPPRVHVSAIKREQEWVFLVQDNGIGIQPKYYDRIFVVFQRLHTLSEYPGTGIGLALCKRIVERHGGTIWVESNAEVGSSFYFSLPITGEKFDTK